MKPTKLKPKFEDCRQCRFFNALVANPICGSCDNGEFFEERTRSRAPSDNELMQIYRRMPNDD